MEGLSAPEQAALSAVACAISQPSALLEAWQRNDLFAETGSDGLCLRVGNEATVAVHLVAQRYERSVRRPFPPLLAALLSMFNGMTIEETPDGRIDVTRESSVRDVWNGWLAVEDVDVDETGDGDFSGLRFGTAYAQCRLLLVDEGRTSGAVVFDDAKGAPIVVAAD